ncbi:MAG: S1 RNA-binding domain-containing protein, partial [Gammaproteobacteria bacterium]
LSAAVAEKIVEHRDANGAFTDRRALRKVERLGEKTFEQSAGFLRIRGREPLDASAVHPEAYPVVERIVAETGRPVDRLIGDRDFLRGLDPARFTDVRFGLPTVTDILAELEKPGRDPRPDFRTATFREGVEKISDLETGMRLEGVVTNVTNFGAFVDVGVHQDGLVHISAMAHRFVKDPHDVVKAGQVVKVKVLEVDIERKRIALTMKLDDAPTPEGRSRKPRETRGRGPRREKPRREQPESALAAALRASLEKG